MSHYIDGIHHVSNVELQRILGDPSKETHVIDVREPEEYEERHIPGVPLIPMGDIVDYLDKLDQKQAYVFVCRSGRRSFEVAKYFHANGFERVSNFEGGMLSWTGVSVSGPEQGE